MKKHDATADDDNNNDNSNDDSNICHGNTGLVFVWDADIRAQLGCRLSC